MMMVYVCRAGRFYSPQIAPLIDPHGNESRENAVMITCGQYAYLLINVLMRFNNDVCQLDELENSSWKIPCRITTLYTTLHRCRVSLFQLTRDCRDWGCFAVAQLYAWMSFINCQQ